MGRAKKTTKAKEPVRVRTRRISNGNESVYLDIYVNGVRKYEYLKMYLVPEKTAADKIRNENTMKAANAIKAARILDITNKKAGISDCSAGDKITLEAFIEAYVMKHEQNGIESRFAKGLKMHLSNSVGMSIKMNAIDKSFCLRFISYLKGLDRKPNTKHFYYKHFTAILNDAVRNNIISKNPFSMLDNTEKVSREDAKREFLTVDEVQRLINTDAPLDKIKQSFLFSCFCGLRFSDVQALRWGDISKDGERYSVRITMQKTKHDLILPLSSDAMRWLPDRPKYADECTPVFSKLSINHINKRLKTWMSNAGIKKQVSFHVARHTFATMLITFGADLYTVSKLLGHTDIKVTQIYAKLVDAKKVEAIELFNGKFK